LSDNTAGALACRLGGVLFGPDRPYAGVAALQDAGPEHVAFCTGRLPPDCTAGILLIAAAVEDRTCIVLDDPKLGFIGLLHELFPVEHSPGIHPMAAVDPSAQIDESATISAGAVVGARCVVGPQTVLHPGVVLYADTQVGARCMIHAGVVLGADGFSFHPTAGGPVKVPQVGRVVVADDVELGANCCVDRAFLGETVVGPGCKLDNLVHLGHNAQLGRYVIIAAGTALSGSVTIGDGAIIGGQVGVVEHIHIGAGAQVGAQSGLSRDVPAGEAVLGTPAQPAARMRRIYAALKYLPEMFRKF
jgi:UDP-3-O-[3-hydroxymyristoyl] glucosamine N-acyltransferase